MQRITLISTNHSESGKCNSDELYKIIETIRPDIIFEELPNNLFDIIYNGNLKTLPHYAPLELKCVKKYLQNYHAKNIPVDIEIGMSQSTNEIFMLKTIEEAEDHKKFENEYNSIKFREGFDFFNSDKYLDFHEKKKLIEKKVLESSPHKNVLLVTYKSFQKVIDSREDSMLQNIYNYSKENKYNQAVFLLGCGHRKSMMKKIQEYDKISKIKLDWRIFYGK